MNKKILVTSEKNNIGKSFFVASLAHKLAQMNRKVLIVEYTINTVSLAEYFDLCEDMIYDLYDILNCTLKDYKRAIRKINNNIELCPAPRSKNKILSMKRNLSDFIDEASKDYDFTIIELTSVVSAPSFNANMIDEFIILNDNNFSSISEINNDFLIAHKNNIENTFIIINKFDKKLARKNNALNQKDFEVMFPKETLTFLMYDKKYEEMSYLKLFGDYQENSDLSNDKPLDKSVKKILEKVI